MCRTTYPTRAAGVSCAARCRKTYPTRAAGVSCAAICRKTYPTQAAGVSCAAICRKTYPTQGPPVSSCVVPAALWRLSQPKGGFALYRVSHHAYPPSVLPTGGVPRGSPEDALDTACGGCLGDPHVWIRPPKN